MKKWKKSIVAFGMVIVGCQALMLSGCTQEKQVSENAKKVITAMMTCPNEELCDLEMFEILELEEQSNDEDAKEISDSIMTNWEKAVGDCFAEKELEKFLNNGVGFTYLGESIVSEKSIQVKSMKVLEKKDSAEKIEVTLSVNDSEEQQVTVEFMYDSEGLIRKVSLE